MKRRSTTFSDHVASDRHLKANASECARRNILIRIDTVNADRSIAFCSIVQRRRGLFRRSYSQGELVWRAEQALAPLNGLGLLPLITVHMEAHTPWAAVPHRWAPVGVLRWLRERLGFAADLRARGIDGPEDPFGLHRAEANTSTT
ncbi:MAG: hypothetical protein MUE88_03760 [Flavobacteriales bacterium]|jgi:hypothetical protein|nr:hypothetical protein [Flavobacteriales bacterium]